MSAPDGQRHEQRPGEQPSGTLPTAPAPILSTAPAEGPRRWWAAIPRHLGRARTSTVVLAVLFVAVGILYLYVRPETTDPSPAGDTGDAPAVPAQVVPLPTEPTTTAPASSARPTTASPTTTGEDGEEAEPTDEGTEPTDEGTPGSEPAETSTTTDSTRTPSGPGSPTGGDDATP